ncbi:putative prohead protease [Idiomarinaceae phage 1N2-2]|uniref:putative prohead protease n=1 Tax=Idiomarinaceae phage 1N2-2 TaxID=1536592 RepID=UPI0004F83FC5|nr:putative prohead protease [Idiomarinaceae phage 1N2-2]AIM40711.1 putative prohead protease [Idiomarinaceae phage 1N2-2]
MTPYNIRYRLYVIQLYTGFTVEYKQLGIEVKDIDEKKRIVSAIVSTSDLDDGGDIILPGAFAETIVNDFKRIKMLWQHKSDTPIGRPIQMTELASGGLQVDSYVSKIRKGEEYLTLAEEGIVTEFSIGYVTQEADYDEKSVRKISKLKLFEFSPVTWGMNPNTELLDIKSANPKDLERILRDAGLSRREAKALVAGGWKNLRDAGNQEEAVIAEAKSALDNLIAAIRQES